MENLDELKSKLNLKVSGINNIPLVGPSIFVANHSCLLDIFYLPGSLLNDSVSLISSRLIFKRILERQLLVNKYLNAMPIEAHGGKEYVNMCLKYAIKLLENNIDLCLFPEGAYLEDRSILHKGRTGAARILFNAAKSEIPVNFIPVAIDIESKQIELDNYCFNDDLVNVTFLEPIVYDKLLDVFLHSSDVNMRNLVLHQIVDEAMRNIAFYLGKEYVDQYIKLFPKNNVIFGNGEIIDSKTAQDKSYVDLYDAQLNERFNHLQRKLIKK
ncbi:MAG: lysophospholipid acyltransferase family protein [Bacilli bacterium]